MWHSKTRLILIRLALALVAPLGFLDAAPDLGDAQDPPSASAAGIVGGACDEAALHGALAGGGLITFNCGGPKEILIANPQTITQNTILDGGGLITITGGLATRLFDVSASASLTLRSLGLDSGYSGASDGGAITNAGALSLDRVTIIHSETDENHSGGAIFTTGPAFITGSVLYGNSGGNGGALFAYGSGALLQINNSTFDSNSATNAVVVGGGKGGALWADIGTDVLIRNSLWIHNTAAGDGGAIYSLGVLTVQDTVVSGNQTTLNPAATTRGFGGGIASYGPLTVTESFLYSNKSLYGGGLSIGEPLAPALAHVRNSHFEFNQALYWGGGINAGSGHTQLTIDTTLLAHNTADLGGGLTRTDTDLMISRTSIGANSAATGGGLANRTALGAGSVVQVSDTTIYSNVVSAAQGGAIDNHARMALRNVTLEGNDTGVYNNASGTPMTMANTVLHSLGANCAGVLPGSLGGNFSSDTSCGLAATGNDVQGLGLLPQLAPYTINAAGTVAFFLPLGGSPLINTAFAACSALDQRGALRPDACDKGAVEYGGMLPALWLPLVRRAP